MTADAAPATTGPAPKARTVVTGAELAEELGVTTWHLTRGQELGVIPPRDHTRGWSAAAADTIRPKAPDLLEAIAAREALGAHRIAELWHQTAGVEATAADVREMADRDRIAVLDTYKGWPLYSVRDAERLAAEHAEELAATVAARVAWIAASRDRHEAAQYLGWKAREFTDVATARHLTPGRFDRYANADLDALAADEALTEQVTASRLIGPDQAAAALEIRRTDWDYVVAAGWIEPAEIATIKTGTYRTVDVPMYTTGAVLALRELPDVDWDAVRAVPKGKPSVLREYAHRSQTRAAIVRRFAAELADRHQVTVWAQYDGSADTWALDWDHHDGRPTRATVAQELQDDTEAAPHASRITLGTPWGEHTRWARQMLQPGASAIVDTETTSLAGLVCEIAITDSATGAPLLNTLVKPGEPVSDGARAIHGITDEELETAPGWGKVLPKVRHVTRGRTVLAYNAQFDRQTIARDTARIGKRLMHLADDDRWGCLMAARTAFHGLRRDWRLDGDHRALGDCHAARTILLDIAEGHGHQFTPADPTP
ncbi:3'-5' exonuclease [Streptomyces sp. H10-C2]|uniref:3'-5' exonuclease n=1 Tax=Streptomyces TaxID=1883 RepID=UPI0018DF1EEB|nr:MULTISPECIES: 3'-5' exonuclease [Streptomyces]MDJ0344248.1 3'-5' exonuclease [Streptomyces sp. PH10-H1]MDJ0373586.1 3'-5' exonuclease [Streptomyces sp. H10-C2]